MKALAAAALLAATAWSVPALPGHWVHNPRERTARGIAEWKRGDFEAADRHLDQALELGGDTARGLFNAGTGRLGAAAPGAALPLLSRAAAANDASAQALRPEALYNLGNAYLAAGDAGRAAESYRAALRLRPDHQAAKHNLELALRDRPEDEPQQGQQQQGGGGGSGDGGDQRQQAGGGGEQGQQPPAQGQPGAPPAPGQMQRSPRLPRFDPQRDMSAEQAASLLEAVENLEREQRRSRAEQQRRERARTATEKDW